MKQCAVILAAGRGSRMGNLTTKIPKGLLAINGFSAVESQLSNLRQLGIENIAIVTGYLADKFEGFGTTNIYNPLWEKSNMVVSLECAFEWSKNYDQILVSYADIFFSIEGLNQLTLCKGQISLLYDLNWLKLWKSRFEQPLTDAETFKVSGKGALLEIGDEALDIKEIQGQYMGVINFSKSGWQIFFDFIHNLPTNKKMSMDMTTALSSFLQTKGIIIDCIPFEGVWGEIDAPTDLQLYKEPKFQRCLISEVI